MKTFLFRISSKVNCFKSAIISKLAPKWHKKRYKIYFHQKFSWYFWAYFEIMGLFRDFHRIDRTESPLKPRSKFDNANAKLQARVTHN